MLNKRISRNAFFTACFSLSSIISYGQCTINTTAVDIGFTLSMDDPTGAGIAIAFNPDEDLYYAGSGGILATNLLTFDETGTQVAAGIDCDYDFRGLWWNQNTGQLEANSIIPVGVRSCDIDGSSYALNTGSIILSSGQPNAQSKGDYDWDADEILYYDDGSIYRYSRTTGTFISSYPITGLPGPSSDLADHTIGYTGCPGQEIVVYDMEEEAIYTIDKSTGAYVATSEMPGGITYPTSWINISWANGFVFFRNGSTWNAYEVFPGCEELTITPPVTTLCEGEEIILDATAESGEGVTWDNGVTNGVSFAPPVGTTTYNAETVDAADCPYSIDILVHALPEVTASADELEICIGAEVTFTGGGADSYSWDPAEVTNGEPYEPTESGIITFTVTGTDETTTCENTATVDVTVNALPVVIANVDDDEICLGDEITFTGSGATSYTWDPAAVEDGVPYTPETAETATYTVTGTDDNGCVNEGSIDVTVHELPIVTAAVDNETICEGNSVTFTGGGATSYEWDMGVEDGVEFTPESPGTETYTVTGTDDNGCQNTATVDVNVNALPEVIANVDNDEICLGDEIILSGEGADTYSWDPEEVEDGVSYTPGEAGTITYTVTGTDDETACENTATVDVIVNALPVVIALVDDFEICLGDEITLTGLGATTYTWDPEEVEDGVPYTPEAAGLVVYTVTGTDDNGCVDEGSVDVNIHELPVVTAAVDNETICEGNSVTFTGGGATSYEWDMGVEDGVEFMPESTGTETYTVTGTDDNGCQNTASIDVEVIENTLEVTGIMIHETVGNDGEIDITVTGGTPDYSFDWDNDGTGDFDDDEDLTGLSADTYTVTVVDEDGCLVTETFILVDQSGIEELDVNLISVYPNPAIDNISITFEGQFDYLIYSTNGTQILAGNGVDKAEVSISHLATGTYFVQVIADGKTNIVKLIKK